MECDMKGFFPWFVQPREAVRVHRSASHRRGWCSRSEPARLRRFATPGRPALSLASLLAFSVVGAACADHRLTAVDADGVRTSGSGVTPVSGPSWEALRDALGNSASGAAYIVGAIQYGGPHQVAVHTTPLPEQEFPIEGGSYIAVSSGDARTIGAECSTNCGGGDGGYYRIGGIDIRVAIPQNADTLTFEYRFWTTDWLEDRFRAYLITGPGSPQVIAQSTPASEGISSFFAVAWSPILREVNLDVRELRGQTVTLRFEAADIGEAVVPSGAVIDNLRISVSSTPPPPPVYDFEGFFRPIENLPVMNVVQAGRSVPIKFSLGGDHGLGIFAADSPSSAPLTPCPLSSATPLEGTAPTAGSALSYDPVSGVYTYAWKTERAWAGTCRELTVRLDDGQERTARFQLR
jgi:hypothetical protein